ncbi:MAG: lamin tail domain-containing protein [Patescibacteria group bacterium]
MRSAFFVLSLLFLPISVFAGVVINEIMYDLEGSDSGREWIEISNFGDMDIDISGWKLYENETNHKISSSDLDILIIPAGGYAVITDNYGKFFLDWPDFNGLVFDSAFSLNNTVGEGLVIRDSELNDVDNVFYSPEWGANGDGNSLQKVDGDWTISNPTPGVSNISQPPGETSELEESQDIEGSLYIPIEKRPQIKAYAGENRIMVAGALGDFYGEGFGFGDEPLKNGRYLWNFGDGTLKEGQNVNHFYRYPGEYRVVLDVSNSDYSIADSLIVNVVKNEICISEIKTGVDSFVELHNPSKEEIDVSGWKIRSREQKFTFSKNSFIRPQSYLVIPSISSGIVFPQGGGVIEFLYPNNLPADSLKYDGNLLDGQSFSRENDNVFVAEETPGARNSEKMVEQVFHMVSHMEYHMEDDEVVHEEDFGKNNMENQKDTQMEDLSGDLEIEANVITIKDNNFGLRDKKLYYVLGVVFLVIFASLGVYFIRRNKIM